MSEYERRVQTSSPAVGAGARRQRSVLLVAEHFGGATLFLVAGSVGLVWLAPDIAAGLYASPRLIGLTHLFTLGWLTMTIFGALYQLPEVAFGARLRSVAMGHVAFATFTPGVVLFTAGMMIARPPLQHTGVALVVTGLVIGITNVGVSLRRPRARDVTWSAVVVALAWLSAALTLGAVLMYDRGSGVLGGARLRVLTLHLHAGIVGWALVMMVGMSHRLLPMFLLAPGTDTRWTRRALVTLVSGLLLLAAGALANLRSVLWIGAMLLAGGACAFAWQARGFFRARKRLDVGMRFAATGITFVLAATITGLALLLAGPTHHRLATAYVIVGLLGGIVLYVIGHFYKIVLLASWTFWYRGKTGEDVVPTIPQMYSARVAQVQLVIMVFGVAMMTTGIGAFLPLAVRTGAAAWLIGVLLFVGQIARIASGGLPRMRARQLEED